MITTKGKNYINRGMLNTGKRRPLSNVKDKEISKTGREDRLSKKDDSLMTELSGVVMEV